MSDLSTVRRFLGFGLLFIIVNVLQIGVVTAILLSMFWPLGLVVLAASVPVVLLVDAQRAPASPGSRGRSRTRRATWPPSVEEGAHGLRVIKAFGRADHVFARFDERALAPPGDLDGEGPRLGAVLDLPRRSSRTSP